MSTSALHVSIRVALPGGDAVEMSGVVRDLQEFAFDERVEVTVTLDADKRNAIAIQQIEDALDAEREAALRKQADAIKAKREQRRGDA